MINKVLNNQKLFAQLAFFGNSSSMLYNRHSSFIIYELLKQ